MAADSNIRNLVDDLRHMASDTLTASTVGSVMRVLLERAAGTCRRLRAVAGQTKIISGPDQLCIVRRSMNVMTRPTAYPLPIHGTRNEIVALHSVLVGRAFRPVRERFLAESMLLELPIIA